MLRWVVLSLFLSYAAVTVNAIAGEETCDALKDIATETKTANCSTDGEKTCDTVSCAAVFPATPPYLPTPLNVLYDITVLPCNDPPAVRMVLKLGGIPNPIVNETYTENATKVIVQNVAELYVTVIQLDGEIGLEMTVQFTLGNVTSVVTFVEYTTIPVKCDSPTASPRPSPSPTAGFVPIGVRPEILLVGLLCVILALFQH